MLEARGLLRQEAGRSSAAAVRSTVSQLLVGISRPNDPTCGGQCPGSARRRTGRTRTITTAMTTLSWTEPELWRRSGRRE